MMPNSTISVVAVEHSHVDVLHTGIWSVVGLVIGLGMIAIVGFIARGLFIYFLTYEAPKDRPINTLMFEEQVRNNK